MVTPFQQPWPQQPAVPRVAKAIPVVAVIMAFAASPVSHPSDLGLVAGSSHLDDRVGFGKFGCIGVAVDGRCWEKCLRMSVWRSSCVRERFDSLSLELRGRILWMQGLRGRSGGRGRICTPAHLS